MCMYVCMYIYIERERDRERERERDYVEILDPRLRFRGSVFI